ncbi:hypothetical protein [Egbenema bharatensis]
MKRSLPLTPKQKAEIVSWIQYITVVLAFIGLWQLLSGGLTAIDRWL